MFTKAEKSLQLDFFKRRVTAWHSQNDALTSTACILSFRENKVCWFQFQLMYNRNWKFLVWKETTAWFGNEIANGCPRMSRSTRRNSSVRYMCADVCMSMQADVFQNKNKIKYHTPGKSFTN